MSAVLYYSNNCPHSQKLLQHLKTTSFATKFQYICIDQRIKDTDGKTKIILQNGSKIVMPPTLTSIPGLMLIDQQYRILYGDQIYQYLQPKEKEAIRQSTENNMEPAAFSFGGGGGGFVVSDTFSFLGQDLESQGDGGLAQMHHYEALNPSLTPQHNLGQHMNDDNIKRSNNKIRDGEVDANRLAEMRGYNVMPSGGGGNSGGAGAYNPNI